MRFSVFVALLVIATVLDLALLGLGLRHPEARLFEPRAAQAAGLPSPTSALPTPTATATSMPPPTPTATSTPLPPTATSTPPPTPTATSMPLPPTPTPEPPAQLLAAKRVSFTPSDRAVRANIRLALSLGKGTLTHIVVAPGEVFSFNAALGPRPSRLPWKYVVVRPTPAPDAPTDAPAPDPERIQGGGLCDLASRYVMAARPLLPARAFRYVNHVRSNGIQLRGVPVRDNVSIWAVGGGPGEQDLRITNLSDGWLEFTVTRKDETISVTAALWDRAP